MKAMKAMKATPKKAKKAKKAKTAKKVVEVLDSYDYEQEEERMRIAMIQHLFRPYGTVVYISKEEQKYQQNDRGH